MTGPLDKEFKWYLDHQDELLKEYDGKVIVIKNCQVLGNYADFAEAVEETAKEHEMGTFLVQKCTAGDEDYTATFHSRVY